MRNKITWIQDKDGEGWNSACGLYRIGRCPDYYGDGSYYKLCWVGSYGQTCQREYSTVGVAKRAASMRSKAKEVAA